MTDTITSDIAITGIGLISPLGIELDQVQENLASSQSGVKQIDLFDEAVTPGGIGGQCVEFNKQTIRKQYLKSHRKNLKVMCRDIMLGVGAANQAIAHAEIDLETIDHQRLGIVYGANLMLSEPTVLSDACFASSELGDTGFDQSRWGTDGFSKMEPLWLLKYLPNMPACHIGIYADARGPNNSLTLDDAAFNLAISEASRVLRRDAADQMIVGATGTRLHPVKSMHARLWDTIAIPDGEAPEQVSKPFDQQRSGQVVAEGAGCLILETTENAQKRGATIHGYILGSGSSCVRTEKEGGNYRAALANAMKAALRNANLTPEQVGHISAHAMSDPKVDREEALAIHDVFGDYGKTIPVTALKSRTGNAGSGSGPMELITSLLALKQGLIPATLNFQANDPEIELNVVHGEPAKTDSKIVLSVNVTRAGQASAVIASV